MSCVEVRIHMCAFASKTVQLYFSAGHQEENRDWDEETMPGMKIKMEHLCSSWLENPGSIKAAGGGLVVSGRDLRETAVI